MTAPGSERRPHRLRWFMDSFLLHRIAWVLCSPMMYGRNPQPYHYTELMLAVADTCVPVYGASFGSLYRQAIHYLVEEGLLIKEEHPEDKKKWEKCIEEARKDKRVKDPRKYCMQRKRIRVRVLLKPSYGFCQDFWTHICETTKYCAVVQVE